MNLNMIPAKNQRLTVDEIYSFLNNVAQESHITIDPVSTAENAHMAGLSAQVHSRASKLFRGSLTSKLINSR